MPDQIELEATKTPPPSIVLTGEGVDRMTGDRLDMLNRMVHGLGMTARTGVEMAEATAQPENLDPQRLAQDLAALQQAYDRLADLMPKSTYPGDRDWKALNSLFEGAFWDKVSAGVGQNPIAFGEAARLMVAGETPAEWSAASKVISYVFDAHVGRNELAAALDVAELWPALSSRGSRPIAELDNENSLQAATSHLEDRINNGQAELRPLLDKLHAIAIRTGDTKISGLNADDD